VPAYRYVARVNWAAFLGAFIGSALGAAGAVSAALLTRGTALESEYHELATHLHEQVSAGKMSHDRAADLLNAVQPTTRRWPPGRDRRVRDAADAWLNLLADAELAAHLPPEPGPEYDVPNDQQDGGTR
jgi:hypothetical protein